MRRLYFLIPLVCLFLASALPLVTRAGTQHDVELRVLGYDRWRSGGPGSLRVIAYDPRSNHGEPGVAVSLTLLDANAKTHQLFHGTTNDEGTLDAHFTVPDDEGSQTLQVAASRDGAAMTPLTSMVTLQRDAKVYLTTDKPLYQPGQTMHLRVLALREPSLAAMASAPMTIEIEDAKGNKVFKHQATTSKFGVASATFDLATEVNMGEYHVRCSVGQDGRYTAEKSITVKKYVLPKFKVAVKTDKNFYQPREVVHGTVQADYFFGKPVANARVSVEALTFDVGERQVGHLDGVTNATGTYTFDLPLPDYFVGQPLDKGKAELGLRVRLEDTAAHAEEHGTQVAIVSQPISAELFPESGHLVPNLPNQLYLVTTYPDGTAAPGDVTVTLPGKTLTVKTDATGFAELTYTPHATVAGQPQQPYYYRRGRGRVAYVQNNDGETLAPPTQPIECKLVAHDARGNEATQSLQLPVAQLKDTLLVRPDKALYRVGDVFHAQILSTKQSGDVYLDFIRDDQTVLTRSVELHHGRGETSFALTPDVYGALVVHAYQIEPSEDVVRDVRKIFVQPARDLLVNVKLDKSQYRPGEDSKLTFIVKDANGAPTLAVLGVDVVDESLFALAERQPGLERVYFLLEKEMMTSRAEVHGLSMESAIGDPKHVDDQSSQRASQALFSQLPAPHLYSLDLDTFRVRLQQLWQHMMQVQSAAYQYRQRHGNQPDSIADLVDDGLVGQALINDPWGHALRIRSNGLVYSVGPDGIAGNGDDVDQNTFYQRYPMGLAVAGHRMAPMEFEGGIARGAVLAEDRAMNAAAPMAMPVDAVDARRERDDGLDYKKTESKDKEAGAGGAATHAGGAPPRIREFFPETLFTAPEVITDATGVASLTVPLADSITTWRLSAFASSPQGKMGNASAGIKVFQDFFVDIDAPVALTQHDLVSLPVAVYNYLPTPQTVSLRLESADWFTAKDGLTREIKLGPNQVSGVSFQIEAIKPGEHPLTVYAAGQQLKDAVRRSLSVLPDGRELVQTHSDRLNQTTEQTVEIPPDAVPDASKVLVTIYPGIFSQVVEGLDAILQMPGGCFEQTSSGTYPDVLVTSYLKKMHKTTPELMMKADGFINAGYQRLLTFEVPGHGFSVFGQAPANPILTAYGLMEFSDMSHVHDVDPNLLARTKGWLLAQQKPDGSWPAGREGFYAEGWSNVPNSDLVATAYIAWALEESGEKGKGVERAVAYIGKHLEQAQDPYTAALSANALVAWNPQSALAEQSLARLLAMRVDEKDATYWRTKIATAAYGTGHAGDVETTALATLALISSGRHEVEVNRALEYIVKSKDARGTWYSTQATVLAMKALVATIDKSGERINADVSVLVNGVKAGSFHLDPNNFDVFHQIDVSSMVKPGANRVTLAVAGKGSALYKIASHYWRPWKNVPAPNSDVLGIDVGYDRTTLAKDDTATCHVAVVNRTHRTANQVMLDVGIPPGFEVNAGDLEALVKKQAICKFSLTGRQVIIYLEKIDPAATLELSWQLRARYPVRAQAPPSRAYEYYNPDRSALTGPQLMTIQ